MADYMRQILTALALKALEFVVHQQLNHCKMKFISFQSTKVRNPEVRCQLEAACL